MQGGLPPASSLVGRPCPRAESGDAIGRQAEPSAVTTGAGPQLGGQRTRRAAVVIRQDRRPKTAQPGRAPAREHFPWLESWSGFRNATRPREAFISEGHHGIRDFKDPNQTQGRKLDRRLRPHAGVGLKSGALLPRLRMSSARQLTKPCPRGRGACLAFGLQSGQFALLKRGAAPRKARMRKSPVVGAPRDLVIMTKKLARPLRYFIRRGAPECRSGFMEGNSVSRQRRPPSNCF